MNVSGGQTSAAPIWAGRDGQKIKRKPYERELERLEAELVKLQGWIRHRDLKVAVIFEGRDSAGKGGVIKRITRRLSPTAFSSQWAVLMLVLGVLILDRRP